MKKAVEYFTSCEDKLKDKISYELLNALFTAKQYKSEFDTAGILLACTAIVHNIPLKDKETGMWVLRLYNDCYGGLITFWKANVLEKFVIKFSCEQPQIDLVSQRVLPSLKFLNTNNEYLVAGLGRPEPDLIDHNDEITYEAKAIEQIDTETLRSMTKGYTDEMINEMNNGLNTFAKGYLKAGVQYRLARSLTMEQMGIAEDSIFYNLVNTAVTGLTDLLEMPLYGENSVQELAKQYNVVIPDSEYENGWDLATDLVSHHYAGGEDFSIYSTEVTILLRMVNLILLDDLSTVNDEVFFGALNELLGNDSALFKNFTKGIANVLGPVTPGQYFLIAVASPIVYEFVYDSDGVNDNYGTIEGYGVEVDLNENRTDNFADILETIAIYIENFLTIVLKIFGIGR